MQHQRFENTGSVISQVVHHGLFLIHRSSWINIHDSWTFIDEHQCIRDASWIPVQGTLQDPDGMACRESSMNHG